EARTSPNLEARRTMSALRMGLLCCLTCLAASAPVAAQKADPPAPGKGPFQIHVIRVGQTFHSIRCKTATGETWILDGSAWTAIPEADGAPPAGEYQIHLVAADKDFSALRFERATGMTWQLRDLKWAKVKEPK